MLSDADIKLALSRSEIAINPLPSPHMIQPASVDLDLGTDFIFPNSEVYIGPGGGIVIPAGVFVLATTLQHIAIGPKHVGRIEGKSTFGRLGLTVHITAGFIDPGFQGRITLEMANLSAVDIQLQVGDPICQISFEKLDTPCDRPYGSEGLGSHYQHQQSVQRSALEKGYV